jgi:hypothetical protein
MTSTLFWLRIPFLLAFISIVALLVWAVVRRAN